MGEYTVTQREPGTNPTLTHKTHKCYLLLEVIDLRQAMTMAAPIIVPIEYLIENPIRFNPKMRIAPPIRATAENRTIRPRIMPAKNTGFPFALPVNFLIASMLCCLIEDTVLDAIPVFYLLFVCPNLISINENCGDVFPLGN